MVPSNKMTDFELKQSLDFGMLKLKRDNKLVKCTDGFV